MDLAQLERRLVRALSQRLPGPDGQLRLAPRPRSGWKPGEYPDDCRHSAALLLVYPIRDRPHILLTVRDRGLQHHAGQVSLPGGAVESGETFDEAALREAHEEVGVDPSQVRVLGGLSLLHVPVSRFVLHPRVAVAGARPRLEPDRREVARVLEVSLDDLRDPERLTVETRVRRSKPVQVPFFRLAGEKVWGATAMVLSEFLCLFDAGPDPWGESTRDP